MKGKYVVAVHSTPQTEEEIAFNLDGLTFLNMLEGMSYEEAQQQARQDIKDMER